MIIEWLGIPHDRTDIIVLCSITLCAVIVTLFFWIVMGIRKRPSTQIWLAMSVVSLIVFGLEIFTIKTSDIPSATQISEKKANNNIETNTQEVVDTSVSFDDIYREFKRNELVAKDLYNGNPYEITAKINSMSTSGLFNLTGGATLTMETKVDNTIVFFYAEFEKEQEENLKQISVGDTITFTGTCYSGNFSDCKLQ